MDLKFQVMNFWSRIVFRMLFIRLIDKREEITLMEDASL